VIGGREIGLPNNGEEAIDRMVEKLKQSFELKALLID